jgi:hypothetical protein
MTISDAMQEIISILQTSSIELGIDPNAIRLERDSIKSVVVPEKILIGIVPKEVVSFENFVSTFWKCSVEFTIVSPTFTRSFELVQKIIFILQSKSSIAISQLKIYTVTTTAQSTNIYIIGCSLLEVNE